MRKLSSQVRSAGRPLAIVAGFVAFGLLSSVAAYYALFSAFRAYDDEGYLLLSIDLFRSGHALYDQVYSQYGPFYFAAFSALFSGLRLDVTHDNARWITLAAWEAIGLVCGLAVLAATKRTLLAFGVQLLAFLGLIGLMHEPLHPGGLVCLLLAGLALAATRLFDRPRIAFAATGALLAALTLTKINVGLFAWVGVALGLATVFEKPWLRRLAFSAAATAAVALPVLLMRPDLGAPWAQRYALHVGLGALCAVLALAAHPADVGAFITRRELGYLAMGAGITTVLVIGAVLLGGTSLGGLADSVLVRPLRQGQAFTSPLYLPVDGPKGALLALALCVLMLIGRRRLRPRATFLFVDAAIRLAAGLALCATAGLLVVAPIGFLLVPLAWIGLLPPWVGRQSTGAAVARRIIVPLAILQTLHAYPVAGSQKQWASFLLVVVGAMIVADSTTDIRTWFAEVRPRWRLLPAATQVAILLAILGLSARQAYASARFLRSRYQARTSLGLPGASRLRLAPEDVEAFQWVTRNLREHCSAFYSLPGLNSFHLWTGQAPPTTANATAWMYLFEPALQARVVADLRAVPNLCLLRHPGLLNFWTSGRPVPDGPLVPFLARDFTLIGEKAGYAIYRRSTPTEGR